MKTWLAPLSALLLPASALFAGPLEEASITRIIKDVRLVDPATGARPAKRDEIIKDNLGVRTGVKSRAELLFQDKTLTRLGAETFFSFRPGTRDLSLERGTMLLQVPKGLGGARIRAASVTASITGTTILMEHLPGSALKVVVLEGSLRLSLNGRVGEILSLTPGKMIIMKPDARSLPDPVDVDLRALSKTSALIDGKSFRGKGKVAVAALPSMALIEKEIAEQRARKAKGGLIATNLVILGKGTKVTAASEDLLESLDHGSGQEVERREGAELAKKDREPKTKKPDGKDGNNDRVESFGAIVINADSLPAGPLIRRGADATFRKKAKAGARIELRGPQLEFKTGGIDGVDLDGGDAVLALAQAGGHGGALFAGTAESPISGTITVEAPITVSTGANSLVVPTGGKGGRVELHAAGEIVIKNTIQVSSDTPGRASARGGHIVVASRATGAAIKVENSAQLLALLSAAAPGAGGTIRFTASNGGIDVKDSRIQADRGLVDLRTTARNGAVLLSNVNLRGDVVKVGAFGANGQLLIGGGTIDAASALKLYAPGSNGEVRFTSDVTLSGASLKTIAAQRVTIDNGKLVTLNDGRAAQVFTDNANYSGFGGNGSTSGTFGGDGAAAPRPLRERPAF